MARALRPAGRLLMSGFLVDDIGLMRAGAEDVGLHYVTELCEGGWALLGLRSEPTPPNV